MNAATNSPPAVAGDALPEVSEQVIDEVAGSIRRLHDETMLEYAQRCGEIILDRFYGGDIDEMRRRGSKSASLRRLAGRVGLSAASLHQTIGIFHVCRQMPEVRRSQHLTPTHIRTVIPLPPPAQRRLLRRAEAEGWTTDQLAHEARREKGRKAKGKGGRPPLPAFVKTVHRLRHVSRPSEAVWGEVDAIERMNVDQIRDLHSTVSSLMRVLRNVNHLLEGHLQPQEERYERAAS